MLYSLGSKNIIIIYIYFLIIDRSYTLTGIFIIVINPNILCLLNLSIIRFFYAFLLGTKY